MTLQTFHIPDSSLQAMPVAMVYSTQLLLTQKAPATPKSGSAGDGLTESITIRATRVAAIFEEIPGYDHSGLNE